MKFVWHFWKNNFQFSGQFIKFPKFKQKSMTLTSVVTLTFDPRSWKIDKATPGYQINIPPQNKVNPSNGLGGVRGQTDIHTYTQTHRGLKCYNIDSGVYGTPCWYGLDGPYRYYRYIFVRRTAACLVNWRSRNHVCQWVLCHHWVKKWQVHIKPFLESMMTLVRYITAQGAIFTDR